MIIVVLVAAGLALGAMGILPTSLFSKAPYNPDKILTGIAQGIEKVKTASSLIDIRAYTKTRDPDAEPYPGSAITDLSMIPAFDIRLNVQGASQKTDSGVNGTAGFTANASFGDFNASLEAEMRQLKDIFYVRATKLPSFFGLDAIKGKWIKITPQDLQNYGMQFNYTEAQDLQKEMDKNKQRIVEELKLAIQVADRDHAIKVLGKPVREAVASTTAYRYDLELDRANLATFYKDYAAALSEKYGTSSPLEFDQSFYNSLNSQDAITAFEYFNKNGHISVWADANGIPVKYAFSFRVVPNTPARSGAAGNQVNIDLSVTLTNINKPVTIEAPAQSLTADDAYMTLTGKTKEEITLEKQASNISKIRFALSEYKYTTGKYPTSLDNLTQSPKDLASTTRCNGNIQCMRSTSSQPFLATIPTDVYTNQPYEYTQTKNGTSFTLTYTVHLPTYVKGMNTHTIVLYDYSDYRHPRMYLAYVEGKNTADPKVTSEEAAKAKTDSDGDKLSDTLETYIGTNPQKKDSNGNGTSDYDEFMNSGRSASTQSFLPF